jgi:Leucine-rich repeat (LRR) protein
MTSLTLLNESITNIENIIQNIPNKEAMKYLCLNENQITNMKNIELLINLEELHLNFNSIEKIEFEISQMKKLKKLWICENKIKKLENLPECIENLWIANNLIEKIPNDFDKYNHIHWKFIEPIIDKYKDNIFILIHFSQRYDTSELIEFFNEKNRSNVIPWIN